MQFGFHLPEKQIRVVLVDCCSGTRRINRWDGPSLPSEDGRIRKRKSRSGMDSHSGYILVNWVNHLSVFYVVSYYPVAGIFAPGASGAPGWMIDGQGLFTCSHQRPTLPSVVTDFNWSMISLNSIVLFTF
jgi:hypothetical protein